ncbi:MAG TPA: hypothetical protein VMF07_05595 [Solirubrobacteraceae bacterium]|nr:hypothetical protein [Solirubrobacteraceae bacterium]
MLTLLVAATPQCATPKGTLIGGITLLVLVLLIIGCSLGWARASNRAHRAEAALEALRAANAPAASAGAHGGSWSPSASTPED